MNILLIALGSHGDVHPFVGLGLRLRERGHRVRVVANAHFGPLVERAGLKFEAFGTDDEYRRMIRNPDLWHKVRSFRVVFEQGVLKYLRPMYDLVARYVREHPPGDTAVVASSLGLGARVAQDKLGFPMATVHLAPAVIRSAHEPPALPGLFMPPWMPLAAKRLTFAAADALLIDRVLAPPVNAFRAEVGLHPVRGIIRDWIHSPDLTIGLFPEWFAAPQPDWPPQVRLTGFPLYDERGLEPMPADLAKFLDDGEPPIAFTPGSAMWHGGRFFAASAGACRALGRRGVLLSRHREHLPAQLPPGVIHVDYAPFSELLPRAAALVHHGGIGTSSQALAAGAPQLVMPMAHDQFDNAARLERLGVARVVPASRYRAPRVAEELGAVLGSPDVAERCRAIEERLRGADPLGETCDLIERLPGAVGGGMGATARRRA